MTATAHSPAAPAPGARIELQIGGMTCASCAARIEKKLNRIDGVAASVNYATEKAVVSAPAHLDPQVLIDEVEKTGYTAALPAPPAADARSRPRRPRADGPASAADRVDRAVGAGDPPRDDPRAAVHLLAVGLPRARCAGRRVGCVAVPPRRVDQPAPRRRDDGHPRLDRRLRGVPVVAVRPLLRPRGHAGHDARIRVDRPAQRRRGEHLLRGRRRGHDVRARRPLLRGAIQAPRRCRLARAPRARCEGCRGAAPWSCRRDRRDPRSRG